MSIPISSLLNDRGSRPMKLSSPHNLRGRLHNITSGSKKPNGFSLPVIVGASIIILVGSLGLALAASNAREGSSRQYQNKVALQIAEAGAALTLEKLNSTYRYLLVEPLLSWGNPNLIPTTLCPGATTSFSSMPTNGNVTKSDGATLGSYTIESYTYTGSKFYGGTGKLRVKGLLKDQNGNTKATSVISQHINIQPKNCGGLFNAPPTSSGFPGLVGGSISLGNADVLGTISGNILCLSCTSTTAAGLANEVNQGPNSVVNGNIFGGQIPLPSIPAPPTSTPTTGPAVNNSATFTAGSNNNGACLVSSGTTYCRISSVDLNGGNKTLTFNTLAGPIRVYVSGSFKVSGNARIIHTQTPDKLIIFGNPADSISANDQTVVLSGGSSAINAFIFMPDANVGINGGSSTPDLLGAIWAKTFGVAGSSSNNADIQVPDGMGGLLTDSLGDSFNISIRDYAAAGTSYWSSYTH